MSVQTPRINQIMQQQELELNHSIQELQGDPLNLEKLLKNISTSFYSDNDSELGEAMKADISEIMRNAENETSFVRTMIDALSTVLEKQPSLEKNLLCQDAILKLISSRTTHLLSNALTAIHDPQKQDEVNQYQQLLVSLYPYLTNIPVDPELKELAQSEATKFFTQGGQPIQLPKSQIVMDLEEYKKNFGRLSELASDSLKALEEGDLLLFNSIDEEGKDLVKYIRTPLISRVSQPLIELDQTIQQSPLSPQMLLDSLNLLNCLYTIHGITTLRARERYEQIPIAIKSTIIAPVIRLIELADEEARQILTPSLDRFKAVAQSKIAELKSLAPYFTLRTEEELDLSPFQEDLYSYAIEFNELIRVIKETEELTSQNFNFESIIVAGRELESLLQRYLETTEEEKNLTREQSLIPYIELLKSDVSSYARNKEELLAALVRIQEQIERLITTSRDPISNEIDSLTLMIDGLSTNPTSTNVDELANEMKSL